MSAGLDKTEQQLKKAHDELAFVREKKADIIEKEKAAINRVEELEKQRILLIVDTYKLNGDDLKKKLASIMPANVQKPASFITKPNNERNNENEENN